jgi:hypothetical protein
MVPANHSADLVPKLLEVFEIQDCSMNSIRDHDDPPSWSRTSLLDSCRSQIIPGDRCRSRRANASSVTGSAVLQVLVDLRPQVNSDKGFITNGPGIVSRRNDDAFTFADFFR